MYKDTAKWLLAFVPIATVITVVISLGPRFSAIRSAGLFGWARLFPLTAGALAVTLIAVVVMIAWCSHILLTDASPWTTLRADDDWMSDAFSKHAVGLPLFLDSSAYNKAENAARTDDATSAEQSAVAATSRRILELSEDLNVRARFGRFIVGYWFCLAVIVGGLITLTAGLPATPDAVTKPTKVSLYLPAGHDAAFTEANGCAGLDTTTAVAVSGFWNRPTLRLFGEGCRAGDWTRRGIFHSPSLLSGRDAVMRVARSLRHGRSAAPLRRRDPGSQLRGGSHTWSQWAAELDIRIRPGAGRTRNQWCSAREH